MEVKKNLRIIRLEAQTVTDDPLSISNFDNTFIVWRNCGVLLPSDQGRYMKEEKRK
jgi:hypothetical protein